MTFVQILLERKLIAFDADTPPCCVLTVSANHRETSWSPTTIIYHCVIHRLVTRARFSYSQLVPDRGQLPSVRQLVGKRVSTVDPPPASQCRTPESTTDSPLVECPYTQSLSIISPVTRCASTWLLELELKFFLANNVRMSTATARS